jgi:putative heme iron utilization protein
VRKQESMVNDPLNPADFDAPGLARHVLRTIRAGALATLEAETGAPFASLVSIATDMDGAPLFLLSELAAHTRHLERDPRASLLLCAGGKGDPLAHPRLTLTGQVIPDDTPRLRRRFLERHPKAALYADFADFSIHRFVLEAGHLNGGFARAARLAAGEILSDLTGAEALIDAEAGAVEHMNAEHRDALALYATVLCGGEPAARSIPLGSMPEARQAAGDLTLRLDFPERVHDSGALRRMLVRLAGEARNTPERSHPAEPA